MTDDPRKGRDISLEYAQLVLDCSRLVGFSRGCGASLLNGDHVQSVRTRNGHAPPLFFFSRLHAGIHSGFHLGIKATRPFPRGADAVGRIGAEMNIQDLPIPDDPSPVPPEFSTAFFGDNRQTEGLGIVDSAVFKCVDRRRSEHFRPRHTDSMSAPSAIKRHHK
jgi:hypothetical protein